MQEAVVVRFIRLINRLVVVAAVVVSDCWQDDGVGEILGDKLVNGCDVVLHSSIIEPVGSDPSALAATLCAAWSPGIRRTSGLPNLSRKRVNIVSTTLVEESHPYLLNSAIGSPIIVEEL